MVLSLALTTSLLLGGAPQQDEALDRTLTEAVRSCERICVATVDELVHVEQVPPAIRRQLWPSEGVDLLRCTVAVHLIGPESEASVFVASPTLEGTPVGTRCLLFLDRERILTLRSSTGTKARLRGATGSTPVFALAADGLWTISDDDTAAVPVGAEAKRSVPLGPLLERLHNRVEEILPIVSCQLVTTGPAPWSTAVDATGRVSCSREDRRPRLPAEDLGRILRLAEAIGSDEIPGEVGRSSGPDSAEYRLTLRTATGPKRVRVHFDARGAIAGLDELIRRLEEACR